ncbi:MAG: MFS transporter [Oscillospiraceae bacterium]|nr:MFS transporter [Oscillospiraceae bacterium]
MSEKNKQGLAGILLMFALLCNSVPVFSQAFTNSSMGAIYAAFPEVNTTVLKLIVTVPSLMQLIFPLVSAFLERYISRNKVITIAFALATVGGVLPALFGNSIYFIIGCRAVFGAGMGMFAPYAMGLIGAFFEGEMRAKLLGWRIAFANIVQILFNFIGGIASNYGWRNSFFGYLVLVPIAIFVLIVIPDAPPIREAQKKEKRKYKFPAYVILMIIGNMLFRCLYTTVNTNLGIVINAEGIGSGTLAATVLSATNVAAFVTGVVYGFIPQRIRKYGTAIGLVALGAALLVWSTALAVVPYILGGLLVGIGFNIFGINYTNMVLDVCDKEMATTVMAVSTSIAGLSQFLSPIIMDFLSSVLKYEGVTGPWRLSATVLLPWGVVMFVAIYFIYRRLDQRKAAAVTSAE